MKQDKLNAARVIRLLIKQGKVALADGNMAEIVDFNQEVGVKIELEKVADHLEAEANKSKKHYPTIVEIGASDIFWNTRGRLEGRKVRYAEHVEELEGGWLRGRFHFFGRFPEMYLAFCKLDKPELLERR